MKLVHFAILGVLLSLDLSAQIIGETDAVSAPFRVKRYKSIEARTMASNSSGDSDYQVGYDQGLAGGDIDGRADAAYCSIYANYSPDPYDYNASFDFENGYFDGYDHAYIAAYEEAINLKASSCASNETFDDFFCECRCINREYYYDGDGDDYYDFNVVFKYQCDPPSTSWKLLTDLYGIDCDDSDPAIHSYNDCGLCSAHDGLTVWYYDNDQDGYYDQTVESCSRPSSGIASRWKTITKGPDCDDEDNLANVTKTWYYFGDDDNYYGEEKESCLRPNEYIGSRWKTDASLGWDCNDNDSNIIGKVKWYYDNDGDGYHGTSVSSCEKPDSGTPSKWIPRKTLGSDCNDFDKNGFVKDGCGVCRSSTDLESIYIDFDGDGYHSVEMTGPCSNRVTQVQRINNPIYDQIVENYHLTLSSEENILCDNLQRIQGSYDHTTTEVSFRFDYSCTTTQNGDLVGWVGYDGYYQLADGRRVWVNVHNGEVASFLIRGDLEPGHPDYEFKDNFLIDFSLGEDCDDFDEGTKANGDWYFDADGDGYYDPNTSPRLSTCSPPNDNWILLENSSGADCDDTDPTATLLITWYFDGDEDSFYGQTQQTCENPGKGTSLESRWTTAPGSGVDCNDEDHEATLATRKWYFDGDDDGYYGIKISSCQNPAMGTLDADKWKTDPGNGLDCDDADPEKQTSNACGECGGSDDPIAYYVDLDGDGYHSVVKTEDCGLPSFDGQTIANSNFPESLIPEAVLSGDEGARTEGTGDCDYTDIPNTSERFRYCEYNDIFFFPENVLSFETLGLDCNDLDASVRADGAWYPDADGDGYHEETAPINSCSPPDTDTYILEDNSSGIDCNDDDATINKEFTWYYDADGDGYYVDTQVNCAPPGFGWSTTSSIGPDIDDADPFNPVLAPSDQDFAIPSLMKIVTGDSGEELISYGGETYTSEEISLVYRGVTFAYEDLIFDKASATNRLIPDKLVIGEKAVLMGGEIVIEAEATAAIATAHMMSGGQTPNETWYNKTTDEWYEAIFAENKGYNHAWGEVLLENEDLENYYKELFDTDQFQVFKAHYADYPAAFAIRYVTSKEEIVEIDGKSTKVTTEIVDETIGEGTPALIITAKRTASGMAKVVVSVHEDSFKASEEELKNFGWKDESGNWVNPEDEEVYNNQLARLQQFRMLMSGLLAYDYKNEVINISDQSPTDQLPAEVYPEYKLGDWGILTKMVEFYELGHHMIHHIRIPEGMWNPDFKDGHPEFDPGNPEDVQLSADKWRIESPASVSGGVDQSLVEVRDLAELIGLAQSLFYTETWNQIGEAWEQFDFGEQVDGMVDAFEEELGVLNGDQGEYRQYHGVGKVTVLTLTTIYAGWKTAAKIANKLAARKAARLSNSPAEILKDKMADFKDAFASAINKTQEFARLSKNLQEKLVADLAESVDDVLGKAIAIKPRLIDSWKQVELSAKRAFPDGVDSGKILRKDIDVLNSLAKFDPDLISDIGQSRIDDFMDNVIKSFPKCKSCGNNGREIIGNLDDIFDDLYEVASNRARGSDGQLLDTFDDFMAEAGQQAKKAQGAVLTLKKMSKNWDQLTEGDTWKLVRFEGDIPDIETEHLLDLKFERIVDGVTLQKSVEMKNWSSARSVSGQTYEQFKAYISSGHKFEYYFSDGLQTDMKNSFQNVFKDISKANELWGANSSFLKSLDPVNIETVNDLIELANDGDLADLINWVK